MNTPVHKAYRSDPINPKLTGFSAKELRHAASIIDRENNRYPPINALTLARKLDALSATLHYTGDEKGRIEFYLEEKGATVTRHFFSISELTVAVNLGPIDLFWPGNVFIKLQEGVTPIDVREYVFGNKKMKVWIPQQKTMKDIFVSGAEKVLCNNPQGLTAGQMKLLVKGGDVDEVA